MLFACDITNCVATGFVWLLLVGPISFPQLNASFKVFHQIMTFYTVEEMKFEGFE